MAKKRTKAQRSAAAKESWERRRAAQALEAAGVAKFTPGPPPAVELPRPMPAPSTTATVTQDGENFFLTVYQDGSMFRHKLQSTTLRLLALDALRIVG